jgi:SNF2 family DNA or RNA helicase
MSDKKMFAQVVLQPILQKREVGLSRLRVVMGQIALRRTKDQVEKAIQLVEKTVEIRKVAFTPGTHFDIHEMLYQTARTAFIGLLSTGAANVFRNFYALFALVLRVRQACCHGELIPLEYRDKIKEFFHSEIQTMGDISEGIDKEEGARLFNKLMLAVSTNSNGNGNGATLVESQECAICLDMLGEESAMILRTCEHVFCRGVSCNTRMVSKFVDPECVYAHYNTCSFRSNAVPRQGRKP